MTSSLATGQRFSSVLLYDAKPFNAHQNSIMMRKYFDASFPKAPISVEQSHGGLLARQTLALDLCVSPSYFDGTPRLL
jgi:hypothetical protein